MAIPKKLIEIDENKAMSLIKRHPEGCWEDGNLEIGGDFVYGWKMIRLSVLAGQRIWETGKVAA